jgi:hypothetical protein
MATPIQQGLGLTTGPNGELFFVFRKAKNLKNDKVCARFAPHRRGRSRVRDVSVLKAWPDNLVREHQRCSL